MTPIDSPTYPLVHRIVGSAFGASCTNFLAALKSVHSTWLSSGHGHHLAWLAAGLLAHCRAGRVHYRISRVHCCIGRVPLLRRCMCSAFALRTRASCHRVLTAATAAAQLGAAAGSPSVRVPIHRPRPHCRRAVASCVGSWYCCLGHLLSLAGAQVTSPWLTRCVQDADRALPSPALL